MEIGEPALQPVELSTLRPTQLTVGMLEVNEKQRQWRDEGERGPEFLGRHLIPVVLGPKGRHYILDHHHLALALQREGVKHVLTSPVANLRSLDAHTFWFVMAHRNWMHLYDADGKLRTYKDIPKSVDQMQDDPFRSLAGALRRVGGYAKDMSFYSEFLWADFLRRNIEKSRIDDNFADALGDALTLSKTKSASYLPGWCGPSLQDPNGGE
ncbi:MAG: ParB-like protein [Candidatus Kaistia colombiensis]|nr:MAG: ParB-like protein [Kaistia sp.]